MKAEYINPFIQGTESTITMVCGEETKLGKVGLKNPPFNEVLTVTIEIVGDLKGYAIFGMELNTAYAIASKMMMGMPVNALDDMSKSALCGLCNMISGSVATVFSGIGKIIDIRPPQMVEGGIAVSVPQLICMPININNVGVLDINVWINE